MSNRLIPIFTRSEITAVKEKDIVFAESDGRKVIIHTLERKYCYNGNLSSLKEMLGQNFYKCHSSIIVNFNKVVSIKEGILRMEGGLKVLMGKNAYLATRKNFMSFVTSHAASGE